MKTCPSCLSENLSEARFCPNCGSPMPAAGTRRETMVEPSMASNKPPRVTQPEGFAAGAAPAGRPVPPPSIPGKAPKGTQFVSPSAPAPEAAAAPTLRTDDRRIVGVLVTYSWKAGGQIFPVREGRNIIGRGSGCDICIPEDESLSEKHAHITYRKDFVIGDLVSMAGTYVNGEPVEEQFVPLQNYVEIRTGSTAWRFVAFEVTP